MQYKPLTHSILLLVCLLSSPAVLAESYFVASGGLFNGGDTLITAEFEDEDYDYERDLKAGGLFHLALGYQLSLGNNSFRFMGGYKFDNIEADDGDSDFDRFPIEAIYIRTIKEKHGIGIGLIRELSPDFTADFDSSSPNDDININFDDATGFLVQYGYRFGLMEFGARATFIDYESNRTPDIDGNNIGVYIALVY